MKNNELPSWVSPFTINRFRWRDAEKLAQGLGVPMVVASVLAGRGLCDLKAARDFLEHKYKLPDPFLFGHMTQAVEAISQALDRKSRIVIHGDYDADGITATALLVLGLRQLGARPEWYLPNRFDEGYGLSARAVSRIAAGGPGLLITVDCGVNYADEVALARRSGFEVVVIDHHHPGVNLPDCHLIHPVVGSYPHADLCGVGLALKVMHALHVQRLAVSSEELPPALKDFLDLVALGTIADLAPLREENRWYVHEGLKLINLGKRPGLHALADVAGCAGSVDSAAISYRLAPRLNAAGRLADPSPPLQLLLTEDPEEAASLASLLHEINGARQDVERQVFEEATRQIEGLEELPPVLVLAGQGWHEGVVGIVASRIVERCHRPAILLSVREGIAKGSGRSIASYDLLEALRAGERFLSIYGGHAQAVGLTLPAEHIDKLRAAIENHAAQTLNPCDLVPSCRVEAVIQGTDLNTDTAEALAGLGPFGVGNPRPRLLAVDALIHHAEATRDGAHLQVRVGVDGVGIRGVGFRLGGRATLLNGSAGRWSLAVQLEADEWQGTVRPQLVVHETCPLGDGWPELGVCGDHCSCFSRPLPTGRLSADAADGPFSAPKDDQWNETTSDPRLFIPVLKSLTRVRDLRGQPGVMSGVAQVLATAERVLLLTCSVARRLPELGHRLPLQALLDGEYSCLGRACAARAEELARTRTLFAEWDVSHQVLSGTHRWDHIVVLDPPFRQPHLNALLAAAKTESVVHLCYGGRERREVVDLLRHVVHPRFAMVCLYRALRLKGGTPEQQLDLDWQEVFAEAAAIAWRQGRVVLTARELVRAREILLSLGIERSSSVRAKLEVQNVPAYAAGEADYEECRKLCLSL